MSALRLPVCTTGVPMRASDVADAQLYVHLMIGRYAGCTAFRTHRGRVQVGTLLLPVRRGTRWGVQVSRNGLVVWWPLDGTVWVNV